MTDCQSFIVNCIVFLLNRYLNTSTKDGFEKQVFTLGDGVLMSFYYGNYTQGIKELISYGVRPDELSEYLKKTRLKSMICRCQNCITDISHFRILH